MSSSALDLLSRSAPWALRQLWRYLPVLVLPPLLSAGLAVAWMLATPSSWKAYQSLLVRDDLLGENFKPGRFSSQENQKNAQEMLLHVARKPEVIYKTLELLGPDKTTLVAAGHWPSEEVIDDLKDAVSIVAPNGAEFGKTDVVVLSVKAGSRTRAKQFADLLATQIELHLRSVRQSQLRSMQTELELGVQQLQREYNLLAQKVKQVELTVGSDLPVLRSLLDRSSSASDVQRALEQIRQERRAAENELEVARKQLELLRAIETDPERFSVSSSELLSMQPIFKKLREGLTDAELRLMTESGRYEPGHPAVMHAREVIAQTSDQIRREARAVIQGLELQTTTAEEKLNRLRTSEQQYDQRLARLAEQRVEYEILARELEKSGETLGKAKTDLARVESLAESADQISLITRIGEPLANLRPDGLSRKSMVGLAILGGLFLGGGLMGLCYRPDPLAPWLPGSPATPSMGRTGDVNTAQLDRPGAFPRDFRDSGRAGEVIAANGTRGPTLEPQPLAHSSGRSPAVASRRETKPATGDEATRSPVAHRPAPTPNPGVQEPILVPQVSQPRQVEPPWGFSVSPAEWFEPTPITVSQLDPLPSPAGQPPQPIPPAGPIARTHPSAAESHRGRLGAHSSDEQARLRSEPVPIPAKIDLTALRQELAEAARLAAITDSETAGTDLATGEADPPGPANPSGSDPSRGARRPPALTEELERLSRSLANYCEMDSTEPSGGGGV